MRTTLAWDEEWVVGVGLYYPVMFVPFEKHHWFLRGVSFGKVVRVWIGADSEHLGI